MAFVSWQGAVTRIEKAAKFRNNQAATCCADEVPRRRVLKLASVAVAAAFLPSAVHSESTYEKNVRKDVAKVSGGRAKAEELKKAVTGWKDAMSEDDELYVLRFIPIWLEPARAAMENVGKQGNVDVGDASTVNNKALEMIGHLLELRVEAKSRRKAGVLRELDEFVETSDDFLKLPGIQRFHS